MRIKSMTGFGKAEGHTDRFLVKAEIKSVNSKFFDLNLRVPRFFGEKEIALRRLLSKRVERGTVQFNLNLENTNTDKSNIRVDKVLANNYYEAFRGLAQNLSLNPDGIFERLMQVPDIIKSEEDAIDDEEWAKIEAIIIKAIDQFDEFRLHEGGSLGKELEKYALQILSYLKEIGPLQQERIGQIKDRINSNLIEFISNEQVDKIRFEQELVYFLDRIDITEEQIRLEKHCNYFLENLNQDGAGKKLNFIAQEMGREINTLGSKSYHFGMQQLVVKMKEELEKIKEQVNNIL